MLSATLAVAPGAAQAANVILSTYSTAYTSNFYGFAYDQTTGMYYMHAGYNSGATVDVYSSAAAFQANAPTSTVALSASGCVSSPCDTIDGTYYAVIGNDLIGRPTTNTAALEEWSLGTGSAITGSTYAAFGGVNGPDTFDWGGFSGMNVYRDGSNLYLLAKKSDNSTWEIATLNPTTLAVSNVVNTGISTLGYAFLMNGELFAGSSYASNQISYAINVQTGQVTPVNYTLTFPYTNYYISDAFYNPTLDQVYFFDQSFTGSTNVWALYDVANASQIFVTTPEPSAWGMSGVALIAAAWLRRRRRAH